MMMLMMLMMMIPTQKASDGFDHNGFSNGCTQYISLSGRYKGIYRKIRLNLVLLEEISKLKKSAEKPLTPSNSTHLVINLHATIPLVVVAVSLHNRMTC